jgi:hypothetical protein
MEIDHVRYGPYVTPNAWGTDPGDGAVTLNDWLCFIDCLIGPCEALPRTPLYSRPCCSWLDFEGEGDVDLLDHAEFVVQTIP